MSRKKTHSKYLGRPRKGSPLYAVQAKRRSYSRLSKALAVVAVIVLAVGIDVVVSQQEANDAANARAEKLVAAANHGQKNGVPATTPISDAQFNAYTVGPSLPRYIFIPSIGVKSIVEQVGVTSSGEMDTPSNVNDTGWFTGSSKPGKPGAMVVDGHVASWVYRGVFWKLASLKNGALIKIQRGDGVTFSYEVVKVQAYSYQNVDMSALLSPIVPGKPGLNLITCTGDVIKSLDGYNQRLVVFAEQVSP